MTPVYMTRDGLRRCNFEELKDLADRVGVGYAGADEDALRENLYFEGSTH